MFENIEKQLQKASYEMGAIVRGFMPTNKSNDENYRNDVRAFLAKTEKERDDLIAKANDKFYGKHELGQLAEIAEKEDLPLGALLMWKSSADINDYFTHTKTSFWGETGILRPEYRMNVSALDSLAGEAIYDMGWMMALRTVDARGMVTFDLAQFIRSMDYYKLQSDVTEIPLSGIRNGKPNPKAPFRYGLGTQVAKWLEGKTVGSSMTEIMAQIRENATLGKAKAAYEVILKKPTKESMIFACQSLESDRISNIIANLNYAVNSMKKQALGIEDTTVVALPITPATPIICYYHPDWKPTVELIERRRVQVPFVLDQLMPDSSLVFVPTYNQSLCGAWEHTGVDKFGFAERKDAAVTKYIGFKLVIPNIENMFIVAQDLFFLNDFTATDFTNKVRCEERYLPTMNDLQHAWVVADKKLS